MDNLKNLIVSQSKKYANDFELAKELVDYYLMSASGTEVNNYTKKVQERWNVHAGRWPEIANSASAIDFNIGGENITISSGTLRHYPVLDRYSKAAVTNLILSSSFPVVKDHSSKARNYRERLRLKRIKDYYQNTVIQPQLEQISMQVDAEIGIKDPSVLDPELLQKREVEIQKRFKEQVPEETQNIMSRIFTPDELVCEALFKEASRVVKLKKKRAIGAESAIVQAGEFYRVGILNGKPYVETCDIGGVRFGSSKSVMDSEDGIWAVYTNYITPEDAVLKYSMHLKQSDVKRLSKMYSPIPGLGNSREENRTKNTIEQTVVDTIADNPALVDAIGDLKTRQGQENYKSLLRVISPKIKEGYGIKEQYVTWRWIRPAKLVERIVDGKKVLLIRDEHYKKDPLAGDTNVETVNIPQIWECTVLDNDFYINIGPVKWQYNSVDDLFNVKLGIVGGYYNTFQNNSKPVSYVDLGMPWNYKYNVVMKKMEEHQATDIGNVLLGTPLMKPKSWTWGEWYASIYKARIAMVSLKKEGTETVDQSIFRSINMSRANEIAQDISQLEYLERKIASAMHTSPESIGNFSQYATNKNIEATREGLDRQMYSYYSRHREIGENLMNALLKIAIYAYKDDEQVKSRIFDDFLRKHFELNFNNYDGTEPVIEIEDDFLNEDKLKTLKNNALTLLQNGMTGSQLAALVDSDTISEVKQFLEESDKKKEKNDELAHERNMELVKEQRAADEAKLKFQQEYLAIEAEKDRKMKVALAEIMSSQMEKAQDVDRNKVNDAIERDLVKLAHEKEQAELDRLEKQKDRDQEKELEEMKIQTIKKKNSV